MISSGPTSPQSAPRLLPTSLLTLLLTLLLALLLTTAGCGEEFATQGVCFADGDCQPGLICHDARLCVAKPDKSHAVVLRLAPPPGQGMVLEHFDAAIGGDVSPLGSTWKLTRPAAVRGTVVRALDTFNSSIPGTLIALAPGKIPGTTIRYDAISYSTPRAFAGSENPAGFQLLLQIGPTYKLTFWPNSALIPPFYTDLKVGGDTESWVLKLPAQKDLVVVTGRLVSGLAKQVSCAADQRASCPTCTALPGMRVMLIDADSRVRSGRVITDKTGAFSLRADASGGPVRLRFAPASATELLPVGMVSAAIDLPTLVKKDKKTYNFGDLNVGARAPVSPRALRVQDVRGAAVAGATVKISAALKSPDGCAGEGKIALKPRFSGLRLMASAPTDAKGEVTFELPPGPVQIEIVPPVEYRVGRWQKDALVLADKVVTVTCPDRAVQRGSLQDFKKALIAGAQVQFLALDGLERPPVTVVSDVEGRFEAPLDMGRWAVAVEPPVSSGLGRYSRHTLQIEAEQEPLPLHMTLPPPAVMVGRVLDQSGAALSGVLVDVMANKLVSLSGGDAPHKTDGSQALLLMETHLLGTTVTGADGRFEVLIETSQLSE